MRSSDHMMGLEQEVWVALVSHTCSLPEHNEVSILDAPFEIH